MEKQFRYKAWANSNILNLIDKIDGQKYPEEKQLAIRFINHTLVVDKIFIAHIEGVPHQFEATNTKETPLLAELARSVNQTDDWLVEYVSSLEESELNKLVEFTFTDGDAGSMNVDEILHHLIIHGAYHRGNVGMILGECGIERPQDTFTNFLHLSEPDRRKIT